MRASPGVEETHSYFLRLKTPLLRRWKKYLSFVSAQFFDNSVLILKSKLFDFDNISYFPRKNKRLTQWRFPVKGKTLQIHKARWNLEQINLRELCLTNGKLWNARYSLASPAFSEWKQLGAHYLCQEMPLYPHTAHKGIKGYCFRKWDNNRGKRGKRRLLFHTN